jgi:type I restriction enzyme, S subunit
MGSEWAPIAHDPQWSVVSLREITTKIGSGATPRGGADAYLPIRAEFALVRSQNVFDRRFDPSGLAFITNEQAAGLHGVVLQPDDILLNITGDGVTFGRACIVPTGVLPACVNQHVSIVRVDPRRADAGYVLAFLTHPDVKRYIESFNAGGSRRAITKGHIESFRLPLPPLPVQRRVARILGALDDKIELSRRMSQTLESMARTLFKSWCIDSDSHLDQAASSEASEIASGWKRVSFGDLVDVARDVVDPARWPGRLYSHYSIPAFDQGRRPTTELGSEIGSIKFQVAPGSVLVSKLNPSIPRVWLVDEELSPNAAASTEFMILRPRHPATAAYLYCLALSSGFKADLEALATGTSGSHQRAQRDAVLALQVTIPPAARIDGFDGLVRPLFRRVARCQSSAAALVAIREALLPALLSDRMAEAAGRSLGS